MHIPPSNVIACPHCHDSLQPLDPVEVGMTLTCPTCAQAFVYSGPKAPPPAPRLVSLASSVPPSAAAAVAGTPSKPAAPATPPAQAAQAAQAARTAPATATHPSTELQPSGTGEQYKAPARSGGYLGCGVSLLSSAALVTLGIIFYSDIQAAFWRYASHIMQNEPNDSAQAATADGTGTLDRAAAGGSQTLSVPERDDPPVGNDRYARPVPDSAPVAAKFDPKNKLALAKLKAATGFMHAGGLAAFDRAVAEMNTAQLNYDLASRNEAERVRDSELGRLQQAIDLAFVHGLEAYDYLIQKKVAQLKAAISIDTAGMTMEDKRDILDQLDECRWLGKVYTVIWWLRDSPKPGGVIYWQWPSFNTTKKGLWSHDRYEEVESLQTRADKRFSGTGAGSQP